VKKYWTALKHADIHDEYRGAFKASFCPRCGHHLPWPVPRLRIGPGNVTYNATPRYRCMKCRLAFVCFCQLMTVEEVASVLESLLGAPGRR